MELPTDRGSVPAFARFVLPIGGLWIHSQRWRLDELPAGNECALWGDGELVAVSRGGAVRRAVARDIAIARLGLQGRLGALYRVDETVPTDGLVRSRLRRWLGGRALVTVGRSGSATLLEAVLRDAALQPIGRPRLSAGGGVLQFARRRDASAVVLRAGLPHDRSDPRRAAEGLERTVEIPDVPTPRLLASGSTGPAIWSVESQLPGRPPRRLSRQVLDDILDGLATMPRSEQLVSATREDLASISQVFPQHGDRLGQFIATVDQATGGERGIFAHGDLWPGNLLVHGGRLVGVVDWGSWHPTAAPGVDLLQLCTAAEQPREPLGSAWLARPWRAPPIQTVLRAHLDRIGVRSDRDYLDALGVAWWAAKVAGTLERYPQRARDQRWTTSNVDAVLASAAA